MEQGTITALLFILLLVVWEHFKPLRRRTQPRLYRWGVNVSLSLLVVIVGSLLLKPAAMGTTELIQRNSWGLLGLLPIALPLKMIAGFLLIEMTFYWWHRINHEIPLLWRFHNIHHIDPDVDVTTSFRFHWVEILYSVVFRLVQVGTLGITPEIYIAYESVFMLATMWHHSNIVLPISLERLLNRLIVTPRMHGIHHSNYRVETDANYSVIFMVWDRLFGTLRLNIPQQLVTVGVPGYASPADNRIQRLLIYPFTRQKSYWKTGETDHTERAASELRGTITQLAE